MWSRASLITTPEAQFAVLPPMESASDGAHAVLLTPAPRDCIISTIITAVHLPTISFIFSPFPFWLLTDLERRDRKAAIYGSYAPNLGRIDK